MGYGCIKNVRWGPLMISKSRVEVMCSGGGHQRNTSQGCQNRGGRGAIPPPMLEEGGASFAPPPQPDLGPGPLGLVFFTLEKNVLCLLFESAIPGVEKHNIDHIL